MRWHDLFVAIALVMVLEGVMPFLNPGGMKKMMTAISEISDSHLRMAGLASMVAGLILLYLVN